jgi:hypothetical protein
MVSRYHLRKIFQMRFIIKMFNLGGYGYEIATVILLTVLMKSEISFFCLRIR